MATKTKKQKTEPYRRFACALCPEEADGNPTFNSGNEFKDHCRTAHPDVIDPEDRIPGTRSGVSFLDGSSWYENTYNWTLPDGRFLCSEQVGGPRSKDDPMRFGG